MEVSPIYHELCHEKRLPTTAKTPRDAIKCTSHNKLSDMHALALIPCAYGARFMHRQFSCWPASFEFPDGARDSFATAYRQCMEREPVDLSGAR